MRAENVPYTEWNTFSIGTFFDGEASFFCDNISGVSLEFSDAFAVVRNTYLFYNASAFYPAENPGGHPAQFFPKGAHGYGNVPLRSTFDRTCGDNRNRKYYRSVHGDCHRRSGSGVLVLGDGRIWNCNLLCRVFSCGEMPHPQPGRELSGRTDVCAGTGVKTAGTCGGVCHFYHICIFWNRQQCAVAFHGGSNYDKSKCIAASGWHRGGCSGRACHYRWREKDCGRLYLAGAGDERILSGRLSFFDVS